MSDSGVLIQGASFFAMTIFTTIGYGTFAPSTDAGKAFTIVYGVFGIAIFSWFLTCMQNLNQLMEASFWKKIKGENAKPNEIERLTLSIAIVFGMCALGMGCLHFTQGEDLSVLDSLYFGIITMTTIGLGDIAPDAGDPDFGWGTFVLYAFWTMMGLSSVAHLLTIIGDSITKAGDERLKQLNEEESRGKSDFTPFMAQRVFQGGRSRPASAQSSRAASVHPEPQEEGAEQKDTLKSGVGVDGDSTQQILKEECGTILTPEELIALTTLLQKVPHSTIERLASLQPDLQLSDI